MIDTVIELTDKRNFVYRMLCARAVAEEHRLLPDVEGVRQASRVNRWPQRHHSYVCHGRVIHCRASACSGEMYQSTIW
jgi:hypothetical protein